MKKILLLIMMMSTLVFAQSYQEFAAKYKYETDYAQALQRAKAEKKNLLMVQVSNYCPWCRKLEKKVLARDIVNEEIQKNYVPLIINREEGKLNKRFATPIVPVTYIVNYKDDTDFKTIRGYQDKEDFLHNLKKL